MVRIQLRPIPVRLGAEVEGEEIHSSGLDALAGPHGWNSAGERVRAAMCGATSRVAALVCARGARKCGRLSCDAGRRTAPSGRTDVR